MAGVFSGRRTQQNGSQQGEKGLNLNKKLCVSPGDQRKMQSLTMNKNKRVPSVLLEAGGKSLQLLLLMR
jgi:hypothetical protein